MHFRRILYDFKPIRCEKVHKRGRVSTGNRFGVYMGWTLTLIHGVCNCNALCHFHLVENRLTETSGFIHLHLEHSYKTHKIYSNISVSKYTLSRKTTLLKPPK